MRPVNKWDSGNASETASPPTNRPSALYLKGKSPLAEPFFVLLLLFLLLQRALKIDQYSKQLWGKRYN